MKIYIYIYLYSYRQMDGWMDRQIRRKNTPFVCRTELKDKCKALGLKQTGNIADLKNRLAVHYVEDAEKKDTLLLVD